MGYGKIMVGVIVGIYILFLGVAKVVSECHQRRTEALSGGTVVLVHSDP